MTELPAEIATMPFETALAELESIVDKLEKGPSRLRRRSSSMSAAKR